MNDYGTHQPVLRRALQLTTGPCLELGMGDFSTPLMAEAAASGRYVLSIESDQQWMSKFKPGSATHRIAPCPTSVIGQPDWNMLPYDVGMWDVALVDQHPAAGRLVSIAALMDHCRFIVVHDTDCRTYFYEPLLRQFKYRYDHKLLMPNTTVVSNFAPFTME